MEQGLTSSKGTHKLQAFEQGLSVEVAGVTLGVDFEADVAFEYMLPIYYDHDIEEYTFI